MEEGEQDRDRGGRKIKEGANEIPVVWASPSQVAREIKASGERPSRCIHHAFPHDVPDKVKGEMDEERRDYFVTTIKEAIPGPD